MQRDQIHPQLITDCHYLGRLPATTVLLHRNAALPWFILVPDTAIGDLLDLPDRQRDRVMADCAAISAFIKQTLGFGKVNFAGLGNVVPQMHLHIIGRREDDLCWPQPVWGNLPAGGEYEHGQLLSWQLDLQKVAGLVPAEIEVQRNGECPG
ncbi:MAG: HIT family protein [Halioglobus sp.]|nr:HIT family protein [Halioglobus sp.]